MLLKGHNNSIAAVTVTDRAVNLAGWYTKAAASVERGPETPFTWADSMTLQSKGWSVRTSANKPVNMPKCLVGGYSFSQQS